MFGPRKGKNKVHPEGCGWLLSEHEGLFSRRVIAETLIRSFMVVEVEVGGQVGLQLAHQVILVERNVFGFDAAR